MLSKSSFYLSIYLQPKLGYHTKFNKFKTKMSLSGASFRKPCGVNGNKIGLALASDMIICAWTACWLLLDAANKYVKTWYDVICNVRCGSGIEKSEFI
jgi:hypothetical protein